MSFLYIQNQVNYEVTSQYSFLEEDIRTRGSAITASNGDPDFWKARHIPKSGKHSLNRFKLTNTPVDEKGDLWIHFNCNAAEGVHLDFHTSSDVSTSNKKLTIEFNAVKQYIYVRPYSSASALSENINIPGIYDVDIHIDMTKGNVTFYIDGAKRGTEYSPIVKDFTKSMVMYGQIGSYGKAPSELIIAEEETIGMRCIEMIIDGEGNYQDGEGTFDLVNDTNLNQDAVKFYGAGNHTWTMSDVSSNINMDKYDIRAVSLGVVVDAQENATHKYVQSIMRSGGSLHTLGGLAKADVGTADKSHQLIIDANPQTGQPWTLAELNGLDVGIRTLAAFEVNITAGIAGAVRGFNSTVPVGALVDGTYPDGTAIDTISLSNGGVLYFHGNSTKVDGRNVLNAMVAVGGKEFALTLYWHDSETLYKTSSANTEMFDLFTDGAAVNVKIY